MTLFFFLISLEIKRELVTGDLRHPKAAALPILAAAGGIVVPIAIFLLITGGTDARGWGIPMATDAAFAIGVLALLGDRIGIGVKLLLVTIAVVDDVAAICVIAIAYSDAVALGWLALALGGRGDAGARRDPGHGLRADRALRLGRDLRVRRPRDARRGCPRAPHPDRRGRRAAAARRTRTPPPSLGQLRDPAGLRLRLGQLPPGVDMRGLIGAAALGGIGFTVSLFITSLAYSEPTLEGAAKLGVLGGSVLAAAIGVAILSPGGRHPSRGEPETGPPV